MKGATLRRLRVKLNAKQRKRLSVRPLREGEVVMFRDGRYQPGSRREDVRAWQERVREALRATLSMPTDGNDVPLDAVMGEERAFDAYVEHAVTLRATPGRTFGAVLTIPRATDGESRFPAVVCIHGHGGQRRTPYDEARIYKQFGKRLAEAGYVTISADVGQHLVQESGRTLMGERLHDLVRCIDYLCTLDVVDADRIGCGGLSLGGEMAMWLGAMDTRVKATVSSGYLTSMDQMEWNHCMCWKFPGLRELVDWADVYALTAPRALQCQNGLREGPNDFWVPLARRVFAEIEPAYVDLAARDHLELVVHPGGHEIALDDLMRFFAEHL